MVASFVTTSHAVSAGPSQPVASSAALPSSASSAAAPHSSSPDGSSPRASSSATPRATTDKHGHALPTMIDARGPTRLFEERPGPGAFAACSSRRPVCVHGAKAISPRAAERALASAERALDGLAALRLPWPRGDFDRGGGPQLDLYLDDRAELAHAVPDLATMDPDWDLAASFIVAPPPSARGCSEEAAISRAVVRAALLGLDAGAEPQLADGAARHIGALVAPCDVVELESLDAFQRTPESGFERTAGAEGSDATGGAALFFAFLEDRYGSGRPGELTASLFAAAPQRTPPLATVFQNEPDVIDVLVANAKAKGSPPLGELLLDFAVERAFIGSRSDDQHLRDVARFGELGRVRFDWSVAYASLPRSLAPAFPIQPTGSTYTWVDLDQAAGGVSLTVVARWEPPAEFRWAIVKVAPDGSEQGRLEPPTQLGQTESQQSLVDLHGLAGLIIVGVNVGSSSAIDPWDPDDGPFSGQGATVTLYPE